MNTFMNAMKQDTNFTLTENGAITHKSTLNGLMDLLRLAEHTALALTQIASLCSRRLLTRMKLML